MVFLQSELTRRQKGKESSGRSSGTTDGGGAFSGNLTDYMSLILQRLGKGSLGMAKNKLGLWRAQNLFENLTFTSR
jgi:hypothetical protein